MKITLKKITINNFRCHQNFETKFGETRTAISAANGVGKTSIYDGFLWLLFGKSTDGRSQYEYRPLDANNEPVRGLVVAVEAVLNIDGTQHTFRKEEHEHVTKLGKYSYPASYWVDEVPKLLKDYQAYIEEIIPETTFKMLTDLAHFNGKLHWTDRREVLMNIAGNVGTPAGFDELLDLLNGRTVDEMKKVIAEQKKKHEKERDEIGPQIQAHQEYANYQMSTESEDDLTVRRSNVVQSLVQIEAERKNVLDQQVQRQKDIDALNKLTCQKLHRETQLKGDTSGTEKLRAEAATWRAQDADLRTELATLNGQADTLKAKVNAKKDEMATMLAHREKIQEDYSALKNGPIPDACPAGDDCPYAATTKGAEDSLQRRKDDLKKSGVTIHDKIKAEVIERDERVKQLGLKNEARLKAEANLLDSEAVSKKRLAEIAEEIQACPGKKPADDDEWNGICANIEEAKVKIGPPVADVLEELEARKSGAEAMRDKYSDALRQADTAKKAKANIADLDAKEKDLSQKIADCDKQLHDIGRYKAAESDLIAAEVNGRFEHVEFKLFKTALNGSIEPCCVALYWGRPYLEMSTGEKIICGVDVVNVLSTYYDVSVPLFVDHGESLTLPLGANAQTIELYAVEGLSVLEVEAT